MIKWVILGLLTIIAFAWLYTRSLLTKRAIKDLIKSRPPMSLDDFLSLFPDRDRAGLEILFYRLQDMLKAEGDNNFPLDPSDQIWKTYRIPEVELAEMIDLIAVECGIDQGSIIAFWEQHTQPTVSDIANLLRVNTRSL